MSQWQTAGKVRMTPKGTWNDSTAYVVLDCVSNTDKTAYYVAKKDVPAGTVLTNTEYWEVVNDISDIASQLTNEIERLEDIVALGYPTTNGVGKFVNAEGTIDAPLSGLTIYGKSVQSDETPAPAAPVDIVTAGSSGTLPMVSAAKNLLRRFVNTSGTGTGCSWTYDAETGTYTLTSTVGSGSEKVVYGGEIGVRNAAGQTLTLSAESITGDSNASVRIHQGDNQLAMIYGSTLSTTFRVTNDEPLTMTLRMGNATASGVTAILKGVQLEVGSARTDFAPMLDKLTAAIPTPNGLPGVPVSSGGNYTDTDGQQWLCDTIDLEAGTYTKRCGVVTLDGSKTYTLGSSGAFYTEVDDLIHATDYQGKMLCDRLTVVDRNGTVASTVNTISGYRDDPNAYPNQNWIYFHVENISTLTDLNTWLGTHPIKVVYVLAAPEVVQLTTAQLTALRSMRGRKGQTNLYSADPAGPEFTAEMYIDIMTYIQSVIDAQDDAPARLTSLEITPATWDNIHPDFNPATEDYAVTLRKGNAVTVNVVVVGADVTVECSTIGGAKSYFSTRTTSSAVGDRKTYACEVNPYDAGVGGGLVIAVTDGNVTRRYYLNITSVE